MAAADAERGDASGGGGEPAGGGHGVEQGEAERGDDRGRPEIALDPFEDGGQRRQLAGRVEVQQLAGQVFAAVQDREAVEQPGADLAAFRVQRPPQVRGVEGCLALLAPAELVAADRAAVVLADRAGSGGPAVLVGGLGGPGQLVQHDRPVTGRAPARVPVADPLLEAGLATGRGGQRLDGGVEMPQVGRAEDDLGEEAVQRGRLEADGLALPVDGRAGHPSAAPERVEDDVAGCRAGVQARVDERRRGRWDGALEGREAEPRLGPKKKRATCHGPIVADGRRVVANGGREWWSRMEPAGHRSAVVRARRGLHAVLRGRHGAVPGAARPH